MPQKIIDVSYAQGRIDWDKVKPNVDAVIIRCGYGSDYVNQDDVQWARNVSECERLGIPYGVYLYAYAKNDNMANSEVAHALRLLKGHHPTLPVYYDEEEAGMGSYCGRAYEIWEKKVKAAGYTPGLYSGYYFRWSYAPSVNPTSWWMAWYASETYVKSHMQHNWKYDIWQYTDSGSCPGISSKGLDMNHGYKEFVSKSLPKKTVDLEIKTNAVYRLYDRKGLDHLFTTSVDERNRLIKAGWAYEGIAWYADPFGIAVFRAYNSKTGDHLLTTSKDEIDKAVAKKTGWKMEGVAFGAKKEGRPVYRLWNTSIKSHFYTTNDTEKANLLKSGWKDEGRDFYA